MISQAITQETSERAERTPKPLREQLRGIDSPLKTRYRTVLAGLKEQDDALRAQMAEAVQDADQAMDAGEMDELTRCAQHWMALLDQRRGVRNQARELRMRMLQEEWRVLRESLGLPS